MVMAHTRFQPEDFYRTALRIACDQPDESAWRTAISRVYYACYLAARNQLMIQGWRFQGRRSVHEQVTQEYRRRGHSGIRNMLRRLKYLRIHADYHLHAARMPTVNDTCRLCQTRRRGAARPAVDEALWLQAEKSASQLLADLAAIRG